MFRILTILFALMLDLLWGDPPNRFHPVALMGQWLKWGHQLASPKHRFKFGLAWTVSGLLIFSLPFWQIERKKKKRFFVFYPFFLKPIFAYRNLRRAVIAIETALHHGNLEEARHQLSWNLVSRDTMNLSHEEVAGATIESLAENLTDSVVAPLLFYGIGGLPAAWGYRFINTADAMWGYRTPEFEQLGKFPARLDDLLNGLPARLTGGLLIIAAGLIGADAKKAALTMFHQHHRTTSPNAGWTMSATAGALGIILSKRDVYHLEGGSREPDTSDIRQALHLADTCVALLLLIFCLSLFTRIFKAKQ